MLKHEDSVKPAFKVGYSLNAGTNAH